MICNYNIIAVFHNCRLCGNVHVFEPGDPRLFDTRPWHAGDRPGGWKFFRVPYFRPADEATASADGGPGDPESGTAHIRQSIISDDR